MSGTHPLWPDYVPQHSISSAVSASASSSTTPLASSSPAVLPGALSSSRPSSSRRIPGTSQPTSSSPPSRTLSPEQFSPPAFAARDDLAAAAAHRRSKRTSLDPPHLQAKTSASSASPSASPPPVAAPRSASALASVSGPLASRLPTEHPDYLSPQRIMEQKPSMRSTSSSAAAVSSLHRLPSSSSSHYTSSSSSSVAHATSTPTEVTARSDRAHPLDSRQPHTLDDSISSCTQTPLPLSSSIPSFHHPSATHPTSVSPISLGSRSTVPIASSSSSSSLTFNPAASSLNADAREAASPTAADMRYNIAAVDPTLPSSSFASRRDASFARLRSGSGSIYGTSRPTAGDAEVSIHVLVWWPSTSKNASSTLARAPLFRDAANVKQKLSMRSTSSQSRSTELSHEHLFERASFGFRPGGASWLREKPSKGRLNSPSSSVGPLGQWKRAILLFRENGSLSIFGEGNALTHTLHCGALSTSDVRSVDDSLFGRPHVLAIQPRQTKARTEVSITTRKQEAALLQDRAKSSEPIFIEFKSDQHLEYVKALLLIYVKPEIYGSAATFDHGGSHRLFRQLHLTISDAKSIMPKWPTELVEATPELPATPPSSFHHHPLMHSHHPASPTSATAGASPASNEIPRSLSHQLASLRYEDQDDSPGSEALTEDALSGSSRAGSRPGSRPSSRLRHNAKPSVSSMRAHPDLDESGSSRPASRAASHYEGQSQAGDDTSSNGEPVSGPLSGHSGASRFVNIPTAVSETAPSVHTSSATYAASTRASAQRRDDKDRFEKSRFDRYCRIRLDGELVARTSLSHAGNNAFAVDKFQLKDVGDAKSLIIEVLHPTQKTGSSLAGAPSPSAVKYILLGIVEIPIETLRRNEDIDGRFPIWSASTFPSLSQQLPSSPTAADEDDGKVPTSFHRGVVGELQLSLRLSEGAVMPLSMYEEVYRRIHDADAAEVVRELATTVREDLIISHLIRVYAASGTIAERISSLIESESVNWGVKMEPELLFRANTLLSRSVDHFQRLLALSWLDDCLGPTVRKICHDPNAPARPDTATSSTSAGSGGGEDAQFDFSTSIRSPPLLPANAIDAIPDGPMTTNSLRKLSETMWQNIYRQRHSCPPDLRTVLHQIRCKVNERYRSSKSTRPGIQGVGAFVFLRLFCAALNAPQLYGLTPSQPGRGAQRKLLLLSKVLLALASKKTAFDKDKDWELVPLNDLLRTYSSAYDDYISVVSTEPPTAAPVQLLGARMDDDADLQAAAQRRLSTLSPIHRESIPRAPYMLDQPLALGSFVCFVADAAEARESVDVYFDASSSTPQSDGQQDDTSAASSASEAEGDSSKTQSDADRIRRKANEFVQICCQIEEAAGMCIEQAGYDPRPIPSERLQRAAMPPSARYGFGSSPGRGEGDASVASFSSSTSSFGTVVVGGDDASPRSSPGRTRNRRATVGTAHANVRSRATEPLSIHDTSFERDSADSPRGARRKSLGLPRSSRRPSQATADGSNTPVYGGSPATGRRRSEMSESHTMTPRPPAPSRALEPLSAPPYRYTFAPRQDEEDDHGSDDELRQAYRMLRAEEAAGTASSHTAAVSSGMAGREAVTWESATPDQVDVGDAPPSGLGVEPMGALLEADDGSTFEPVYPRSAAASNSGPPPSRSVQQSIDLARAPAHRSADEMQELNAAPHEVPLASLRSGFRASLAAAPSTQPGAATRASERRSEGETSRRHSTDQPVAAPRNYSLPQSLADRKNSIPASLATRESSDGFESVLEDAYAQTRASLPASASMPAVSMPAVDAAHAKKKKWWKP